MKHKKEIMMKKNERNLYYWSSYFGIKFFEWLFKILLWFKLKKIYNLLLKKIVLSFGEDFFIEREEYCPIKKCIVTNVILTIPSRGCEYYFKHGGCEMCGFNNEIKKYKLNLVHPSGIDFLVNVILDYFSLVYFEKNTYSILSIFMAGSFFNSRELSEISQKKVLDYFLSSNFNKLFLESRVEHIYKYSDLIIDFSQKIKERSKKLEISLGFECSDGFVRNKIIKKAVLKSDFERAINFLKKNNLIVSSYVLLGWPYSNEKEILLKTIETIKYVWLVGVDIANIEIYCVQDKTQWAELYKNGFFNPISLWSVVEFLQMLNRLDGHWRLGGFSDWPKPLACSTSCPNCEKEILDALNRLRIDHDPATLLNLKVCECATKTKGGKL